jgi:acyl phosphate:glycerol-3-phosphate acyltransferase
VAIIFISLLVGAYLLGSVPSAYLAARWSHGIDIRHYGSGNVGVSNLWNSTSRWVALPVIIVEILKGVGPVWAAQYLGLPVYAQAVVGVAAVAGNNWPLFLGFSGGRSILVTEVVAATLPLVNGLVPWEAIVALSIAIAGRLILRDSSLAVLAALSAMPLLSWGLDRPLALTLAFLILLVIAVIRRLTAPRTSLTATVTKRELLLNRLLLDRDIEDRKAWLNRRPLSPRER